MTASLIIHRARVGRSLGLTLYAQAGTWPSKSDTYLGVFNTRELAQVAYDCLNGRPRHDVRWLALGRLIFPCNDVVPAGLDDFLAVMIDPEVAADVVRRVNGD